MNNSINLRLLTQHNHAKLFPQHSGRIVTIDFVTSLRPMYTEHSWWRGTVVERRSLASELSLSCARPAADG